MKEVIYRFKAVSFLHALTIWLKKVMPLPLRQGHHLQTSFDATTTTKNEFARWCLNINRSGQKIQPPRKMSDD